MSKQFLIALAAIVVILGAIVVVTKHNQPGTTTGGSNGQPTNHVEGNNAKGVTLVEYGDYECPVCGSFFPVVKQVEAKYNNDIAFQFRNLPLTSIHPNAFAAARAAEAASLQGKFWQMHDLLYENQGAWASASNPETYFQSYASSLGLNLNTFNADYQSDAVNNSINADIAAFNKTGSDMATPTFFLDGKRLENAQLVNSDFAPSADAFSKVLDAEIAAKNKPAH